MYNNNNNNNKNDVKKKIKKNDNIIRAIISLACLHDNSSFLSLW